MPTAYIKKLAKLNHTTVNKLEKFWSQAKEIAKSEGNGKAWGLITTIFQNKLKKEGYKVKAFTSLADTEKLLTKESSKALLAMLKHSYFKNVRDDIKQIWARSRNAEDTANEWLLKYHPLIVECEKLAIEPKVCARICYTKYHKENPYTKHLNKNNDVSLNTLKKEALQYFEGLKKWKEDNELLNELNKQATASKEDTMKNKFQFNGEVITASSKQEAIKVFAEKENPNEKYDKICKEIADLEKSTSPKFEEVEDDSAVGEVQLGNRFCLEYTMYVTASTNPKICVKVELGRILSKRHTVVIYRRAIKAKSVGEAVAFITNCIDNAKPLAKPLASFESAINSKKFKDWES